MQTKPDSDYSRFLDAFLPEFEYLLARRKDAESGLDRLRNYYAKLPSLDQGPRPAKGRIAVVAIDPWRNWAAEIKAASLVANLVICDDPFLYVQDHIENFAYFYSSTYGAEDTEHRFLEHLARQIDWMWEVMPLVKAGIVMFRPLRMATDDITSAIERSVADYLAEHLEILGYSVTTYPRWVEYRLPVLDERQMIELDSALWSELHISAGEVAQLTLKPRLTIHSLTTWQGLLLADSVEGTFWTGSDDHWRLARDAANGLSPGTKTLSFVEAFTRPALEQMPAEDLLAVRANEEAFDTFRRELALTENMISSYPDEERFTSEITDIFEEVFRPNIRMIESAMQHNTLLSNLPYMAASAGFSIAATATGGSATATSALFGALAGVAGFSSVFQDLLKPEAKVRREPAFVLWKLGVRESSTA